jgi:hypothetical protein
MKHKWLVALMLSLLFQPPTLPQAQAEEKEPVDLIFTEILAMYQDLEMDEFFKLAKVPVEHRKAIDFDPTKAQFYDLMDKTYEFTKPERKMLEQQGFFARETGWYGGFGIIYYNIYAADLPVLVTTDSLLHALHKSYDDILKEMEELFFHPAIGQVLAATRDQILELSRTTEDRYSRASLKDADAYLTIALSLLAGEVQESLLENDEVVSQVLADIDSLRMLVPGQDPPIHLFGGKRWVDFSQFKPRGHYTESETLQRYFRCLMWLGRADTGMNVLETPRQLRSAATLVLALRQAKKVGTLKEMDEIINFMVGRSDNLTVFGLAGLLDELGIDSITDLASDESLRELTDGLKKGRAGTQFIRSQMVVSWPDDTVKVAPPSLFQLFGQRYIIDSFVLSKVVFDDITFKGVKQERFMPSPLDVMASLGNDEALALLESELRTWNYSANLQANREFVASHKPEFWQDNLYNLWLDALRTLDRPMVNQHAPQAMQTRAWQHKQLNTQLASWAQLRHDTILYAKQSYTSAIGCEYPAGYVEPYPEFYAKLGFFAHRAATLFDGATFIDGAARKRYSPFFANMKETMTRLEAMARKELAAEPFSRSEKRWLETLIRRLDGSGYGATPVYNGWYVDLFYGGQKSAIEWDPTVADVHTDPNSRQVLEVGVGRIDTLVMAVDNDGDKSMFAGPTFSYYQFHQPATKRMTDPEWKDMLIQEGPPPRPDWTGSFVSPMAR